MGIAASLFLYKFLYKKYISVNDFIIIHFYITCSIYTDTYLNLLKGKRDFSTF